MRELLRIWGPTLLVLVALYVVFRVALGYALPFFVAVGVAILIEPLVNVLERHARLPRGLAVAIVIVLLLLLVVLFLVLGVARIAAEMQVLAAGIPGYYRHLEKISAQLYEQYGEWLQSLPPGVQQQLLDLQREWVFASGRALESLAGALQDALRSLPSLLVVIVVTMIASFFISRDSAMIRDALLNLLPESWRAPTRQLAQKLAGSLVSFINAMVVLVVLSTVATTFGLFIIEAPYALLLGVTSGILDAIPIIGPAVLFVPWAAYHILFGSISFGVKLLVVYGVVSAVRTVVQAQVIGDRMGLHPLITLLALFVGIQVFGPVGIAIGPLAAAILAAMIDIGVLPINGSKSM